MKCEGCEWFRYLLLTDNALKNKQIPSVITDLRKCERGWCDKDVQYLTCQTDFSKKMKKKSRQIMGNMKKAQIIKDSSMGAISGTI